MEYDKIKGPNVNEKSADQLCTILHASFSLKSLKIVIITTNPILWENSSSFIILQ